MNSDEDVVLVLYELLTAFRAPRSRSDIAPVFPARAAGAFWRNSFRERVLLRGCGAPAPLAVSQRSSKLVDLWFVIWIIVGFNF